ncbi:MAG: acylphosphatase [Solobacterium sp.]|nr:acylphosphatase [Solobacterium sp.]
MKRYRVIVEGRVQGVGFRGFCMVHATELSLTGSVRNMENGMVEIYIQGEDSAILKFLQLVREGDRFIRVDDITVKPVPVVPKEKKFSYNFYDGGWSW